MGTECRAIPWTPVSECGLSDEGKIGIYWGTQCLKETEFQNLWLKDLTHMMTSNEVHMVS